MEQYVLSLPFIKEGTTEKVWQIKMPLKSIYNKNLCCKEQNVSSEQCRQVETINDHIIIFCLF
jgi:hypothetical protein